MKVINIKRQVFEPGDVIRLEGQYVPTEEQRNGTRMIDVMILKTNVSRNGTVNCTGITRNVKKVTIKENQMDNAGYLGKIDLGIFIREEII